MSIRNLIPPRRWLAYLGIFVTLGIGLCVALAAYVDWRDRQEWAEACAEADRLDPGWRWGDLAAARPAMPAERNSVTHIAEAARLLNSLPRVTNRDVFFISSDHRVPPNRRLPVDTVACLRKLFASNPAMDEAEAIRDCPTGQMPLPTAGLFNQVISGQFDAVNVTKHLLYPRLALLADDGDLGAALQQVRLMVYTSRPPAECPQEMPNLIATTVRIFAARGVERVLGQGEPSPAALESARRLLEAESSRTTLLPGFRGQRAFIEDIIRSLDDGTESRRSVAYSGLFADPHNWTHWAWADAWLARLTGADLRLSNATASLRCLTQMVDWLKESPDGLKIHEAEWAELRAKLPTGAAFYFAAIPAIVADERNGDAQFRCANAAIAAEQFRREAGHWPATLDELVPKYLAAVPRDPCDLQPLRLARRADGIVIYSVGLDGKDDGGAIASDGAANATDVGIRLWDVAQRRQPPLPSTVAPTRPAAKPLAAAAQPPA